MQAFKCTHENFVLHPICDSLSTEAPCQLTSELRLKMETRAFYQMKILSVCEHRNKLFIL